MLGYCLDTYSPGNLSEFARLLGTDHQNIWFYLNKERVPYFDFLLQVCFDLAIPPLEFFTASALPTINSSWFVIERLPVVSRGKKKRVIAEDKGKTAPSVGVGAGRRYPSSAYPRSGGAAARLRCYYAL